MGEVVLPTNGTFLSTCLEKTPRPSKRRDQHTKKLVSLIPNSRRKLVHDHTDLSGKPSCTAAATQQAYAVTTIYPEDSHFMAVTAALTDASLTVNKSGSITWLRRQE